MKSKPISKSPATPRGPTPELTSSHATDESHARTTPSFKRILVPIDFSDCSARALEHAAVLARKFDSKLVLLHVVEPAVYPENYLITPATVDEANQGVMAASRERLEGLRRDSSIEALSVEILVRVGRAHSEIPDTARATGSELVVMGTHGSSGLKNVLLGGTAERVLRQTSCPVLMIRQQ